MTVPRITPVLEPNAEQRRQLAKTLHGPDGQPLNLFRTLAHLPELMRRVNALGGYFMAHGGVSARDRELVTLRTAAHAQCDYEIGQHRWLGARAGLSPEEIEAALDSSSDHPWLADDRALLAFADEVAESGTISDAGWKVLESRFGSLQRLELLLLVGFYMMLGMVLNGVGVELDASVANAVES